MLILRYQWEILVMNKKGKALGLTNSVFVCPVDSRSVVLVGFVSFTQTQTYLARGTVS